MILIGLGVGLLLARTRFEFVGGLIVAATFGLIVGGLLSGGFNGVTAGACGSSQGASPFPTEIGALAAGAASIEIEARLRRCRHRHGGGRPPGTSAARAATAVGPRSRPRSDRPDDRHRTNGGGLFGILVDPVELAGHAPDRTRSSDLRTRCQRRDGRRRLAARAIGLVEVGLNAGSATVDLGRRAGDRELQMELNAGSRPASRCPNLSMTGTIQANAGSVRLCVPAGVGLRIETGGSVAASYDFHDLVQDGSVWTSPGYDDAPVRIDLRTDGTAASFTLDPEGGCDG